MKPNSLINSILNMLIEIPDRICQEAIEAHLIQQKGSIPTIEGRSKEVERRESHVAEIVCAIIAKEFMKQKLLPYHKK